MYYEQKELTTPHIVATIMFCQFICAFAALGMPPFFSLILDRSLHNQTDYLIGWLYTVPTLFTALSSTWWGKMADRFGKRPLLIRAQLGLSISFLLAGFATNTWIFFIALMLQGILGGTLAASNAYLATIIENGKLLRGLTAMQWASRAALVIAPIGVGLWINIESPIILYRYLAILPLIAAFLVSQLPDKPTTPNQAKYTQAIHHQRTSAKQLYGLQFAFIFATVITFPYFISHVQQQFNIQVIASAGLLFGMPHLMYLLLALPLAQWLSKHYRLNALLIAFGLLSISFIGQAECTSIIWLVIHRLLMGVGMTLGFISIHGLVTDLIHEDNAGATFGWFESSSKWGGVGAGMLAGIAVAALDTRVPFFIGALVMSVACGYLILVLAYHQQRKP